MTDKNGVRVQQGSLESDNGRPSYVWGKEAMGKPRILATCCSSSSMAIGIKADLE
jgi:hypothetical protein